jgi:hypothetical protein
MYTEVSTMEEALEVARKFLDIGFDISISKLNNGNYAINTIEK